MTLDDYAESVAVPAAPAKSPFSIESMRKAIDDTLVTLPSDKKGCFLTSIKLDPATGTYTVQGAIAARLNDIWTIGVTFDVPLSQIHESTGFVGIKASW